MCSPPRCLRVPAPVRPVRTTRATQRCHSCRVSMGSGRLASGQRIYFLGANETIGTMAEKALADPRLAVLLPESVSASVIAAGMLPAISSWVALDQARTTSAGSACARSRRHGDSGAISRADRQALGRGREILLLGEMRARSSAPVCSVRIISFASPGRRPTVTRWPTLRARSTSFSTISGAA